MQEAAEAAVAEELPPPSTSQALHAHDGMVLLAAAATVHLLCSGGYTTHLPKGMACGQHAGGLVLLGVPAFDRRGNGWA